MEQTTPRSGKPREASDSGEDSAVAGPGVYEGGIPSQAALADWQTETTRRQVAAVSRVDGLVRTRTALALDLNTELSQVKATGAALDRVEAAGAQTGIITLITRALSRRSTTLERRSVAGELLQQYEQVSASLQRASAFTDELQLCALELQQEVDRLHEAGGTARRNAERAEARVHEMDVELAMLESGQGGVAHDERERRIDQLRYSVKSEATALALFRASTGLCREELGPARALRDTVLDLHGDMARFVLESTSAVNTSGRRVQALGLAADTPMVIAELHEALRQLDGTVQATESYIEEAHLLLTKVLPELSREIRERNNAGAQSLTGDLESAGRARAKERADHALREAAASEVQRFLIDGEQE